MHSCPQAHRATIIRALNRTVQPTALQDVTSIVLAHYDVAVRESFEEGYRRAVEDMAARLQAMEAENGR